MMSEYQLYSQDYIGEFEDICDVCKDPKPIDEIEVYDIDERGGQAQVCRDCVDKGWAEE